MKPIIRVSVPLPLRPPSLDTITRPLLSSSQVHEAETEREVILWPEISGAHIFSNVCCAAIEPHQSIGHHR